MAQCEFLSVDSFIKTLPSRGADKKSVTSCRLPEMSRRRRKVPPHYCTASEADAQRFSHDRRDPAWYPNSSFITSHASIQRGNANFPPKMLLFGLLVTSLVTSTMGQSPGPTSAPSPASVSTPFPTSVPTRSPPFPTIGPTVAPTESFAPSSNPSQSQQPSISTAPTSAPTTAQPSASPTQLPTQFPTFEVPSEAAENFRQTLLITEPREEFNETEQALYEGLLMSYTDDFAPTAIDTTTFCEVVTQQLTDCTASNPICTNSGVNVSDPDSLVGYINFVDVFCRYTSRVDVVTDFPSRLVAYTDTQADLVTQQMIDLGLPVIRAFAATIVTVPTNPPTTSPVASPTVSPRPTLSPVIATISPTGTPTFSPSNDGPTPSSPSLVPTRIPTLAPSGGGDSGLTTSAIVGIVVALGFVALVGLFIFYRRRTKARSLTQSGTTVDEADGKIKSARSLGVGGFHNSAHDAYNGAETDLRGNLAMSPSGQSQESMYSSPEMGLGDDWDVADDGRIIISDEFDAYKDENIDKLTRGVEENVPGFEVEMNMAITHALMDPDNNDEITPAVLWGCAKNPSGEEIEASVLCEVNDWMRSTIDGGTQEQKRAFMQTVLSRMVTSVRLGVVNAEDASRTIHESAALLGLPLANELPMTTVLISGMRMPAAPSYMISVLKEFGTIEAAAVAPNQKGFGIVRFKHPKAVQAVMRKYRSTTSQIVIQDVAVQIKTLTPGGDTR